MDGAAFAAYVEKVLVPELSPGTVVILDNLATHKNAEAENAMRQAGCRFRFLPPYSPVLNPIEMAFSKLKAHLRRIITTRSDKSTASLIEWVTKTSVFGRSLSPTSSSSSAAA